MVGDFSVPAKLTIIEAMPKIFFNTRDQLIVVNPDLIAAVQADGNYSRVLYINKREIPLTIGISKLEMTLRHNGGKNNKFVRLGRSFIINHTYLYKIDLQKQQIILSDGNLQELRLNLSKKQLKPYKEATVDSVVMKNDNEAKGNFGN